MVFTKDILEQHFGLSVTGKYESGVYFDINGMVYLRFSEETHKVYLDDTQIEIPSVDDLEYLLTIIKPYNHD